MQPLIGVIPWSRLMHCEQDLIGFGVVREEIDYRWISDTRSRSLLILLLISRH
jgi:hypothetical protein